MRLSGHDNELLRLHEVIVTCTMLLLFHSADAMSSDVTCQRLHDAIYAKNWEAVDFARQCGPGSNAIIGEALLVHDKELRTIAAECLSAIGSAADVRLVEIGLSDDALDVRLRAFRVVERGYVSLSSSVALIKKYLAAEPEEIMRARAVLCLGRVSGPNAELMDWLERLLATERSPEVRDRCSWALAKLGDKERYQAICKELKSIDKQACYSALSALVYIGRKESAKLLESLLDDPYPIESDGPAHLGRYRSIGDVCISAIGSLAQHRFSFDATERRSFSQREREEVRAYLRTLR